MLIAAKDDIEKALLEAVKGDSAAVAIPDEPVADITTTELANIQEPAGDPVQKIVTRISTSGGRNWGINVGRFPSQYKARKVLLTTALSEMTTLDGSLRKVVRRQGGFDANFMGLNQETADLACRRLTAKQVNCVIVEPGSGA